VDDGDHYVSILSRTFVLGEFLLVSCVLWVGRMNCFSTRICCCSLNRFLEFCCALCVRIEIFSRFFHAHPVLLTSI